MRAISCFYSARGNVMDYGKQIYELSSFINEQEKWLECVLGKLHWTKDYISSASACLAQCPYNANHYVPNSSLESHKVRCWYSSLGVKVDGETAQSMTSTGAFYSGVDIPHVHIDRATEGAILKVATKLEAEKSLPQAIGGGKLSASSSHITNKQQSDSVENAKSTPPELLNEPPNRIISYIKSWQKIPNDFVPIQLSTLNLAQVKGWLFQNLPDKHVHSSALGGEILTVETIMNWLSSDSLNVPCLTPDALLGKLTPMLGLKSKSLVLDLWKYIHISRLQLEHGIQDSVVEDIVPLTAAALLNRPEDDEKEAPTISERIKELMPETGSEEEVDGTVETSLPLPMDHVFYKFTTSERRTLYDYAVEVTSSTRSSSKLKELDSDLYRDDAAALKAKLKAQKQLSSFGDDQEEGGSNILEQLKRKRDYRRRRQAYRAKNVHITRRTPREIFRDIINNRMEEIATAATESLAQGSSKATNGIHEDSVTADTVTIAGSGGVDQEEQEQEEERPGSPETEDTKVVKDLHGEEEYRSERSRSYKRKKHHHRSRSRSRSGSRSRSKERRHKKHKKHRSRSRSHSGGRSRHKRKH